MKAVLHLAMVLLLAILATLVARIEYFRGFALHHQHQAERYAEMIRVRNNISPVLVESALEVASQNPDDIRLNSRFRSVLYHRAVAETYQEAAHHPWLVVKEPSPPVSSYED